MSLGEAAGTAKPMPSRTSRLSAGGHRHLGGDDAGGAWTARLTWSSVTESAYAPLRSSTWSFMRRGLLGGRVGDRGRGPAGRRRAARRRRWRRRRQGRGGGWSSGAERGEPRRELGEHLAVQGAVEQRGGQQGGAAEAARTAASSRWSGTPAARGSASQPARTSSPSGVRPSPRPSRPVEVRPAVRRPSAGRTRPAGWTSGGRLAVVRMLRDVRAVGADVGEPGDAHRPAPTCRVPPSSGRRPDGPARSGASDQSAHGTRVAAAETSPRHQPSRST